MKSINVLVVDDSSFIRNVLTSIINADAKLNVIGTAANGFEAVEKAEELLPDVITLDIKMPKMDGLEALRLIMERCPTPVIMVSSLTEEGANATLEALSIGALDFIAKSGGDSPQTLLRLQHLLIEKIKAVGRFDKKRLMRKQGITVGPAQTPEKSRRLPVAEVVAIGTSTGGPRALQELLPSLPANFPVGGLVVQHMPTPFLLPFAERMDRLCKVTVKIAEAGEPLTPGVFLIAPGGTHLKIKRRGKTPATVYLDKEPADALHRPSVTQTFLSVAKAYPSASLGIVMTGMGNDGLEGAAAMKKVNCGIIAEDETTCVVYGMPRAVVEKKLADRVLPLGQLSSAILKSVAFQ